MRNWSSTPTQAPSFNVDVYQARLNEIAGLTTSGEPVLKLFWGGSECYYVDGQPVPRFGFELKMPHNFGERLFVPRWVIAENTDPYQLNALGGKNNLAIEVPEKGYYTPWIFVSSHSKCVVNCNEGKLCFGAYKKPDSAELKYIQECTYKLRADKLRNDPRKPVDMNKVAQDLKDQQYKKEQARIKDEENNELFIKEWYKTHATKRAMNIFPK